MSKSDPTPPKSKKLSKGQLKHLWEERGNSEPPDKPSDAKLIQGFRNRKKTQLDANFSTTNRKLKVVADEIDQLKSRNIEFVAIFGVLFTFISIQFQQFAITNKVLGLLIGILSLGGLLLLASILIISASFQNIGKLVLAALLILLSCIILWFGWRGFDKYLDDQNYCTYLKEKMILAEEKDREHLKPRYKEQCQ